MATTKKKTIRGTTQKRTVKRAQKGNSKYVTRSQKPAGKLDTFSDLLSKLELEAEKIAKRVIERAEEASTDLRQGIEELLDKVRTNGLYSVASDTKDDFERELRRLVEDVVDRAKDVELLPLHALNRDRIIAEAKKNLEELRDRLSKTDFVTRAKDSASHTKDQVLSILSIPSQGEWTKLQRKITSLEKRVATLNKKAA